MNYIKRRENFLKKMNDNALFVIGSGISKHKSADAYFDFEVNSNFYYLTGLKRENFYLVIKKLKDKVTQKLYIEKEDEKLAKWVGHKLSKEKAKDISGIEDISYVESFWQDIYSHLYSDVKSLYVNIENDVNAKSLNDTQTMVEDIKKKFPHINVENAFSIIAEMRKIKENEEIKNIKKAIDITKKAFERVLDNALPNKMEYEVEACLDFVFKSHNVKHPAFPTIMASGKNATILHYVDNDNIIKDGDLVLLDFGARYDMYCADITRTFPISGKFTKRQKEVYKAVLEAQKAIIDLIKPGIHFDKMNELAKEVLFRELKNINLVSQMEELEKYYYHKSGHFLGIDTHDVGNRDCILEKGMVVTVEPGLYIEDENIGIRIEDDVLVTEDGNEVLSKDIIKEIQEIEKYMGDNNEL